MLVRLFWVFFLLFSCGAQAALCQQPPLNAPATTAPTPAAAPNGKAIFDQHCTACHGRLGEGVNATITMAGPPLLAVHNPATVMTAMEVGPSHMPRFAFVLSVDQMRAVADYVTQKLAVIPMNLGTVPEGGRYYRLYCDACHGPTARGDVLAFVGVNPPSLANVSPSMVAGVIRTGFGPMPSFPPQVLSDEQLDSVVKYVQYMQHPADPGGSPLGYFGPVAEGFIAWMALFVIIGLCAWIEKGGKG